MKPRRVISIFLCMVLMIICLGLPVVSAAGTITLSVDLDFLSKTVTNKSSYSNTWDLNTSWLQAGNQPADYYATHDPYVKTVKLMFATGGNATRDLFVDPNNRSNLTDYKFDNLITACRAGSWILRNLLKRPHDSRVGNSASSRCWGMALPSFGSLSKAPSPVRTTR